MTARDLELSKQWHRREVELQVGHWKEPHLSKVLHCTFFLFNNIAKMAAFFKDILGGAKSSVSSAATVSDGSSHITPATLCSKNVFRT